MFYTVERKTNGLKEVFDRNYKLEAASILFCNYTAFPIHSVLSKLNAKAVIVKMSQKTFVISFIRIRWKRSLFGQTKKEIRIFNINNYLYSPTFANKS